MNEMGEAGNPLVIHLVTIHQDGRPVTASRVSWNDLVVDGKSWPEDMMDAAGRQLSDGKMIGCGRPPAEPEGFLSGDVALVESSHPALCAFLSGQLAQVISIVAVRHGDYYLVTHIGPSGTGFKIGDKILAATVGKSQRTWPAAA